MILQENAELWKHRYKDAINPKFSRQRKNKQTSPPSPVRSRQHTNTSMSNADVIDVDVHVPTVMAPENEEESRNANPSRKAETEEQSVQQSLALAKPETEEEEEQVITDTDKCVNDKSKSKQNQLDEDGFTKVTYRRNKKNIDPKIRPNCMEGTREGNFALKVAEIKSLSWLFVSRLAEDTKEEDLKNYLKINGFPNCECQQIITKKKTLYNSFKIGVPTNKKAEILDPEFWPRGILVNNFLNLKRIVSANRQMTSERKL